MEKWAALSRNIAIVGPYPPPYGGVSVSLERAIPYMDQAGLDYVVYNTNPSKAEHPNVVDLGWSVLWMTQMLLRSRHTVIQFSTSKWWVRIFAALLHVTTGAKIIIYARGYSLPDSYFRGGLIQRALVKWSVKNFRVALATNPALGERIAEMGIPRKNIEVIPAFIPPIAMPIEDGIPAEVRDFCANKAPILGASGGYMVINGGDVYGLHEIARLAMELVEEFPKLGIVVYIPAGAERDIEKFRDLIDEVSKPPLSSHILFYSSEGELCPFFSICDLFLRPTTTDGDANSIREALHFGIPVLASDVIPRPEGARTYRKQHFEEFVERTRGVLRNLEKERQAIQDRSHYNAAHRLIDLYVRLLNEP